MNEQFILSIMEKFSSLDIAALELTLGDATVCLQKDAAFSPSKIVQHGAVQAFPGSFPAQNTAVPVSTAVQPIPAAAVQSADTSAAVSARTDKNASAAVIKSPIVGTFYRSPSPDSPSYAEEGKTVKKGQAICILEAMKMMNTLEAEFDCVIEKILVSNGDLVEFDQPLFQVRKI